MTEQEHHAPAPETAVAIVRIFDALRAIVFNAWTDPKHVAQWWGPHHLAKSSLDGTP